MIPSFPIRSSQSRLAAGFLVVLPFLFFWRETLGRTTLGDKDAVFWFYPAYKFVAEQLRQGHLPLLTPYLYCGAPLLAEWQAGVFDPINWVYLFGVTSRTLTLTLQLSFALAMLAMFAYARSIGLGRRASVLAAVIYGLSGLTVGRTIYPGFIHIVALAPLALYFTERLHQRGRWRDAVGGALIVAWQAFAAHPQPLIYSSLVACTYALFRLRIADCGLRNLKSLTAVFRWVRPRPRGQNLGGDPCLSTGDTREVLPAAPTGLHASENRCTAFSAAIRDPGSAIRDRIRFLVQFALMYIAGAGLAAIQLLPAAELARDSVRRDWPWELFTLHSLHPVSLLTTLFPFFHGEGKGPFQMPYWGPYWHNSEGQIYLGAIVLSLAAAGAVAAWRQRVSIARFWSLIAVAGVVLSLGKYSGPVARALFHVPVIGQFRGPNRHWMEVVLAVAVLAGFAADRLFRPDRPDREAARPVARWARSISALLVLLCAAVGGIVLWRPESAERWLRVGDWSQLPPGFLQQAGAEFYVPAIASLCGAVAVWLFAGGGRRGRWYAVLLAVLILDLHHYAAFAPINNPAKLETLVGRAMPPALAAEQHERDPLRYHVMLNPMTGEFNPFWFYGHEMLSGYDPLLNQQVKDFLGVDEAGRTFNTTMLEGRDRTLDLLNVRYVFVPPVFEEANRAALANTDRWHERVERSEPPPYRDYRIYENLRAMPRAWLVRRARPEWEGDQHKLIRGEIAGFDPRATALVEPVHEVRDRWYRDFESKPESLLAGRATILERTPSRLVVETESEEPAILLVSELAWPDWTLKVDGREAAWHRADFFLRAAPLASAGKHRVEWDYNPRALKNGAVVSLTTALALLLLFWWDTRRLKGGDAASSA